MSSNFDSYDNTTAFHGYEQAFLNARPATEKGTHTMTRVGGVENRRRFSNARWAAFCAIHGAGTFHARPCDATVKHPARRL